MAMPVFDHTHHKITEATFSFHMHQDEKNQLIPSINSWDTINFKVPWIDWPISDHAHPKNFDQLLIYVDLYQSAKN